MFELKEVLEAVFTQGLPMIAVYWILERPFIATWLAKIEPFLIEKLGLNLSVARRAMAFVLSVILSVGAWSIYAAMGYDAFPVDFEGWANLTVWLSSVTFTGSQVIHAKDL